MMLQCKATESVRSALERFKCSNRPVLVACSGGGDSVALALLIAKNHDSTVILASIQHHLRGNESLIDAQSVIALADLLSSKTNRKILAQIVEAPLDSTTGIGTEAAARTLRREHLAAMAQSYSAAAVFMGHTLDDQAETLLLRLIRGAGTSALGCIRKRSHLPHKTPISRPLLSTFRSDLRAILIRESIPWREDSSNLSPVFTRNLIRHQVLKPLIDRFGPIVVQNMARHAAWLAGQGKKERNQVKKMLVLCELPQAGPKVVLKLDVLLSFKPSSVASLLHYIWLREHWPATDLARRHLDGMASHLFDERPLPGLPGGIELRRDSHVLSLGPAFPSTPNTPIGR
jgi:tRNA(Ile)-lysidine synthetase-like protein